MNRYSLITKILPNRPVNIFILITLTLSSLLASFLSRTPFDLNSYSVSLALFNTDRMACRVLTEIAIPGCCL